MAAFLDNLLLLGGYNTTVVCLGAAMLGAGAGIIGTFAYLRKRAMVSDAVSHATLPGVCVGFILGILIMGAGRSLSLLLIGAGISAVLGILAVDWIKRHTRLPEDAAIGTVLSTFYGLGMALLSHIQTMPTAGQAGLEDVLLGNTAGMLRHEAELIAIAATLLTLIAALFFKELALICFDEAYAAARGWPVARLDLLMMGLLVAITVIGLKTVGLVLIIALAIIPPAAARFWTQRVIRMVAIAALIGALGGYVGAALSATAPNLPTGAVIVLTLALLFAISLFMAPARGLVGAALRYLRFRIAVAERQGLLALAVGQPVLEPLSRLVLRRRGYLTATGSATTIGLSAARRIERDQALWNRYLADYPDEAFGHPDWSLRPIERVLPSDLVAELDRRVRDSAQIACEPARP